MSPPPPPVPDDDEGPGAPFVLVIAEAALELVPREIASHTACRNAGARVNRKPTKMILDGSIHHSAMRRLDDRERRGRPDIVHFCLLEALGSPLNLRGLLDTWVHTRDDRVLHFDPSLKLPRNQERFKGVLEKLYADGRLDNGLITLENDVDLAALLGRFPAARVIGLVEGQAADVSGLVSGMAGEQDSTDAPPGPVVFVIGGFAHGAFAGESAGLFTARASVHPTAVDAWIAVSRVLAACERLPLPIIKSHSQSEPHSPADLTDKTI